MFAIRSLGYYQDAHTFGGSFGVSSGAADRSYSAA